MIDAWAGGECFSHIEEIVLAIVQKYRFIKAERACRTRCVSLLRRAATSAKSWGLGSRHGEWKSSDGGGATRNAGRRGSRERGESSLKERHVYAIESAGCDMKWDKGGRSTVASSRAKRGCQATITARVALGD